MRHARRIAPLTAWRDKLFSSLCHANTIPHGVDGPVRRTHKRASQTSNPSSVTGIRVADLGQLDTRFSKS